MRGLGTDIEQVARIAQLSENERFLKKCYTESELAYAAARGAGRAETLTGMFCAKEAFAKATGGGIRGFSLRDVEVLHDGLGRPFLSLSHSLAERFSGSFWLSVSHTRDYATAVVIYE